VKAMARARDTGRNTAPRRPPARPGPHTTPGPRRAAVRPTSVIAIRARSLAGAWLALQSDICCGVLINFSAA